MHNSYNYTMRGALTGAPSEESKPMARCIGKLESGKRCGVSLVGSGDMCASCKKRCAEKYQAPEAAKPFRAHDLVPELGKKKPGRPAKKGQASEVEQELQQIASICLTCAGEASCGDMRVTTCAAFSPKGENPAVCAESQTDHSEDKLDMVEWTRDEERTQGMLLLIGIDVSIGLLQSVVDEQLQAAEEYAAAIHLQASDNEDIEVPAMPFFLKGFQTEAVDAEISPESPTPPQEAIIPSTAPASPLERLIPFVPAPEPPKGLNVPLAPEEIAALRDCEITPEDVRELVLLLLDGKLRRLPDAA